jgi:hypothetical protein
VPVKTKKLAKLPGHSVAPIDLGVKVKAVTPKGLGNYIARCVAAAAPHTVPQILEQLRLGAITGDLSLIREGLKVFGLITNGPGIVVNQNNTNTANAQAAATASVKSFDAVVRQLAQQKAGGDTVIEAEVVSE